MANEQHTAQLDWSGADDVSVQSANTVLVQGLGDELVFSFGYAAPPIALATMNDDQMQEHLKKHAVEVRQIVRLGLPARVAMTLLQNLQGTLAAQPRITAGVEQRETTP